MLSPKANPSGLVYHGYESLKVRFSSFSVIGSGPISSGSEYIISGSSPSRKGVVDKRYSSKDGMLESELDIELSRVEVSGAVG